MIQQNQYPGPIGSLTGARSLVPAPEPMDSLMNKAANLVSSLHDLNEQLAYTRARVFGESEGPAKSDSCNTVPAPIPALQISIENAQILLADAHSQLSSILNRL